MVATVTKVRGFKPGRRLIFKGVKNPQHTFPSEDKAIGPMP
jgi:hypothetical protein